MIAVIGDSANAGSIGVHVKTGFEMIGTHADVGFKFGRWLDTVMMQRALGRERGRCRTGDVGLNHRELAVDRQQDAIELVAAAQDQPARRDHAVGTLLAREPQVFLDPVDWHFLRRAGTPRTPRGLSGNQWRSRATRHRRPCGRRGLGCD